MATLIFPVQKDGLLVDVLIGLDGATTTAHVVAGRPIPKPIRCRGIIDTGTDISAVDIAILQRLGVPVKLQTTTHTMAGSLAVKIFEISVGITDLEIQVAQS
jgi:hypothetical protein